MAPKNIIGFVTTVVNKEILDSYSKYLQNPNIRIDDKIAYNWLEDATAKLFGGISRGGSEKLLPDIVINDETLIKLFREKLGIPADESVEIETKFKRTQIAPSAIDLPVTVKDIAFQLSQTTTSVGSSILSEAVRKTFKKGQMLSEIVALNANGGIGWFSLLKRKDPELYKAFYNKARFLQISYKTGTSVTALNLYTPLNRFTSPPFEMNYSKGKGALKLYFNNAFERQLLNALQKVQPLQVSSLEQLKEDFNALNFNKRIKVKTQGSKEIIIKVPTGGSIPVTKATLAIEQAEAKLSKRLTSKKPNSQKFISNVQWTMLTQQRLGNSMLTFGDPEPPEIKERSGRFRRSVQVTANYRTKILQYTYNPLYRSLEHYGYHPELQVERAIREVAQQLYAREFSIIRRGGLA